MKKRSKTYNCNKPPCDAKACFECVQFAEKSKMCLAYGFKNLDSEIKNCKRE